MHCSNCGKQILDDSKFCRYCGASTEETPAKKSYVDIDSAGNNIGMGEHKELVIFLIVLAVSVVIAFIVFPIGDGSQGGSPGFSIGGLTGDDKAAYDIIVKASDSFKDPSSVRLVSGTLSQDGSFLFCGLSAKNGFGARGTDYYSISSSGYISEENDPNSLYYSKSELDIEKINDELDKHFKSFS